MDDTLLLPEEAEGRAEPPSLHLPEGLSFGAVEVASPSQQYVEVLCTSDTAEINCTQLIVGLGLDCI